MSTTVELNRAIERAETAEGQILLLKSRIRYLEGLLCDRCEGEGLLFTDFGDRDGIDCGKCQGTGRPL